MTANTNRKGRIKLIKNGQTIRSVESDINKLPDNADGTGFKEHFNQLREQYINENMKVNQNLNQKESELTELKQNSNEIDIKRDSSDPFKEAKESMTPEQKENRDKSSKTIDLNFQKAEK